MLSGLFLAVLALSACNSGDGDETNTGGQQATGTEKQQTRTGKDGGDKPKAGGNASKQSCDAKGINAREGKEGTCVRGDQRFTLANRGSTLALKELDLKVSGKIVRRPQLEGDIGRVEAPKTETFVVIPLAVTNKTSEPQRFDTQQNQIRLRIGPRSFPENFNANSAVETSFVSTSDKVAPGKTRNGAVVFRLPKDTVDELRQRSADPQLLVWDFSTAGNNRPADGAIRLWQ
jgi:Domain of unknown function (DUF4352)